MRPKRRLDWPVSFGREQMMRILLTTQPAYGHFRPLLPLAEALRTRGHDVQVATSRKFGPVVEAHGLPRKPAGLDWLESDKSTIPDELRAPQDSTLETFFAHQFVRMTAERMARDVASLAQQWRPDVIVRESTEFGGALAGELLEIPVVSVQVASPSLMIPSLLAEVERAWNEARVDLGLPSDPGLERLQSQPVVCFAPPDLHDPDVSLPPGLTSFRADPPRGATLPTEMDGLGFQRPMVYATLGTVFNDPKYELPFFPAVLDGLRDEAVDLVVTVGPNVDPTSLGDQPPSVHVAAYLPQRSVLERCSVVICHGGYGTLLDAIDAAVPLVVVPFGADQYINAASVERLGIGQVIKEEELTPVTLREAVLALLTEPAWRRNIGQLRDQWHALPGPDAAAFLVERLVAMVSPAAAAARVLRFR